MSFRMNESRMPKFIDLFCGCGGLSWGFQTAGLEPVLGIEILEDPTRTYSRNLNVPALCKSVSQFVQDWKNYISTEESPEGWTEDAIDSLRHGIEVIIGGPPCQGFSPLGMMSRGVNRTEIHDHLNRLWQDYIDAVVLFRPSIVVTENVPQFQKSTEFMGFLLRLDGLGYTSVSKVLNAYEYGVPQVRKRSFTLSVLNGEPSFPEPVEERLTVRDAIGDMSLWPDEKNWHVGRNPTPVSIERYKTVPPGGNRFDLMKARPDITPQCWLNKPKGTTDVFGRLEWDRPAVTIRTEFFKPEKGRYLHPEADRPLTHREAALIQSFPLDYEFLGSKISVARQIGEAVPPMLARAVGLQVRKILGRGVSV